MKGPSSTPIRLGRDQRAKRANEERCGGAELVAVGERELLQNRLPADGDLKDDLSSIVLSLCAANETALGRAGRQLDGAVMLDLQAFSDDANRRPLGVG